MTGLGDMEAEAQKAFPGEWPGFHFTSMDVLRVEYWRDWSPPLEYYHNGIRVDRARAVELIGE